MAKKTTKPALSGAEITALANDITARIKGPLEPLEADLAAFKPRWTGKGPHKIALHGITAQGRDKAQALGNWANAARRAVGQGAFE